MTPRDPGLNRREAHCGIARDSNLNILIQNDFLIYFNRMLTRGRRRSPCKWNLPGHFRGFAAMVPHCCPNCPVV